MTTESSDAELVERARVGDGAAVAELYERHRGAARRLATGYPRAGDPDDLVNEAFERVIGALGRGAGPEESFRAYLFVTLRRLAARHSGRHRVDPVPEVPEPVLAAADGPAFDAADRQLVMDAYQSLPTRWQTVLWHTAVEGRRPREIAPLLGVSANAAAAFASRARERLREAYLQAHLQVPPPPACAPHRARLGGYVRNRLSPRDQTLVGTHLDGCDDCRGLVAELSDINGLFVRSLVPAFAAAGQVAALAGVGAGAGAGAGAGSAGGGAAGSGGSWVSRFRPRARPNPAVVAAATLVVLAALATALVSFDSGPEPPGPEPADAAAPDEGAPPPPPAAPAPDVPPPDRPAPTPLDAEPAAAVEAAPEDEPPAPPVTRPVRNPDAARPASPTTSVAPRASTTTTAPAPPDEPAAPPTTAAPPAPRPTTPPTTAPPAPRPTTPPTTAAPPPPTTPPTTAPPPAPPALGPVTWDAGARRVRVTLRNPGPVPTDFLVLGVTLQGGAITSGWPTGCLLSAPLVLGAACALGPIEPGSTAVAEVPVLVTGAGQTATATLCAVGFLSLDCATDLLDTTTVPLTP